MTPTVDIRTGDCLQVLRTLESCSVHCCVTSPPYWGLRDYGVEGQLGLEKTPDEYVAKMVEVFSEVRRVLRDDGTFWMNLGDCYHNGDKGGHERSTTGKQATNHGTVKGITVNRLWQNGLKPKYLVGMPWRVAFALQVDGWWLRQDIIWHKPNPMPESVTDRCMKAHEYIFLLTKSARYFYDSEAVKEASVDPDGSASRYAYEFSGRTEGYVVCPNDKDGQRYAPKGVREFRGTRNKRSVWTVPSAPYGEAHFATFPPDLIRPCILAGTSARGCCPECGSPWERVVERSGGSIGHSWHDHSVDLEQGQRVTDPTANGSIARCKDGNGQEYRVETVGWQPSCTCGEKSTTPCTALDPFGGSGTTGQVALELGRKAILIELNPDYVKLSERRTHVTPGLAIS